MEDNQESSTLLLQNNIAQKPLYSATAVRHMATCQQTITRPISMSSVQENMIPDFMKSVKKHLLGALTVREITQPTFQDILHYHSWKPNKQNHHYQQKPEQSNPMKNLKSLRLDPTTNPFDKIIDPGYNSIAKFEPVVTYANNKFKYYYSPHQHLSIDESLVGTRCRTLLTRYLPNKQHHKSGIKCWMLSDAINYYCLSFFCYRGAIDQTNKEEIRKNGLSYVVAHNLLNMSNYSMKGYHVGKKSQKKNVLLLSSYEKAQNKTITIRKKNEPRQVEKPAIVNEYNEHMGDQNTDGGSKTRLIYNRYYSVDNQRMDGSKKDNTRQTIVEAETSTNVPRIGVQKLPGRLERVCVVCSRKDGRPKRKSRTICDRWNKGFHGVTN
ncbi:piggyBac transposable element-derived protein 4-like [Vespula squamosa]|uniref:PiggyBac transposable element-derived protein 4-like n=1 Tax=Vespula squamosa TaxID=30214 RepID=A0ABD2BGL4_VESSQ